MTTTDKLTRLTKGIPTKTGTPQVQVGLNKEDSTHVKTEDSTHVHSAQSTRRGHKPQNTSPRQKNKITATRLLVRNTGRHAEAPRACRHDPPHTKEETTAGRRGHSATSRKDRHRRTTNGNHRGIVHPIPRVPTPDADHQSQERDQQTGATTITASQTSPTTSHRSGANTPASTNLASTGGYHDVAIDRGSHAQQRPAHQHPRNWQHRGGHTNTPTHGRRRRQVTAAAPTQGTATITDSGQHTSIHETGNTGGAHDHHSRTSPTTSHGGGANAGHRHNH